MKVNRLKLVNFRNHGETLLDLDRITFILGANASGKSSILMALEMLLTGKCAVTDAAGRGAEDLVREGQGDFTVQAEIDLGLAATMTVQRVRGQRGHLLNIQAAGVLPVAAAQQKLYDRLGTNEDVLSAVLNAANFVEAKPAEQKKLLAQVIAGGEIPVPAEIAKLLNGEQVRSLADVDNLYRLFYTERTEVNRFLREHLERPEKPTAEEALDPAAVKAHIQEYEKQLRKFTVQRGELVAGRNSYAERKASLERQIAQIVTLSDVELDGLREAVADRKAYEAGQRVLADLEALQAQTRKVIGNLESLGEGDCPTCLRELDAGMTRTMLKKLRKERDELEKKIAIYREEQDGRTSPDEAAGKLEADRQKRELVKQVRAELDKLKEPKAEHLERLDAEIEKFQSRLADLRQQQTEATAYLVKLAEWEKQAGLWDKCSKEKARLEKLVDFFGPDGVKAQLVVDRGAAFIERLNGYLDGFGFRVAWAEDELAVSAGGEMLAIHQLSESERFRFGVAFQIALAEATGVKLVVIDRADVLDEASRRLLSKMLYESELDQAIVLSTARELPPVAVSPPEGLVFYWLEKGENGASAISSGKAAETISGVGVRG